MTFETLKTIAAFGGLGLGVINLCIVVYKEFLKKPKLVVEVEASEIRWRGAGDYDFKIDLNMVASHGDVYIKGIFIEHPCEVFGPNNLSRKLHINKAIKHNLKTLLDMSAEDYDEKVKSLFSSAESTRDLCIKQGERKSLTITDRFCSERLMDGWLEVPLTKWSLTVDYGSKRFVTDFKFINNYKEESPGFHEWHS
jgi:hypothetical protein